MSVFLGVVMMLAFLIAVFVIFRGVSPIIVLLLLAIAWPLLAGSSFWDLLTNVLQKGGEQYASTIVIIVFGAWFGQVLVQTGIAESMIRTAVELAGDRPITVAWAVSLITALLGKVEDADLTETITQLAQLQNALEATLTAGSSLLHTSIVDFIRL